ncbi:MAG: cobalamin biosynthesis protein CobD [Lachnospiraceae bacterium]|nr:cobalamin biosynthesis protein CobD [Lachnospiraceae bacterium]
MKYHIIAFVAGFILDLILGDPYNWPHPVKFIGNLISITEKKLYIENGEKKNIGRGLLMVISVLSVTAITSMALLAICYHLHPIAGVVAESVMTYTIFATKCLKDESMKVYKKLKDGDIEGARRAVSMIVGRDTDVLDDIGIAKAAIETVAENTSDGVIAPMIYTAIGGPALGLLYKAVNTMDSMVGYKNDRYIYFGRCAAKLDDIVNYIPARISALIMIIACMFLGKDYSAHNAFYIFKRDRYKHASPNSAQTESACAGTLGIRLAGDAVYFGKLHKKPFIGDEIRKVEYYDIVRANRLMYGTSVICIVLCVSLMVAFALK